MENTIYLYEELSKTHDVSVIQKPTLNIIGFKINSNHRLIINILRQYGWSISVFPTHIRLVIMPHIRRKHIDRFLKDLQTIMKNTL